MSTESNRRRSVIIGLAITLMLMLTARLFEPTPPGRWLELRTFELLHSLIPAFRAEGLPVMVVDISRMPGGDDTPIDRKTLGDIIEALADNKPVAIAVDIDFSPGPNGLMTDHDEEFFKRCLRIGQGERPDGRHMQPVPIFLGVGRAQQSSPNTWLAFPDYKGLAAAIGVFPNDTRLVPRWFASPAYGDQKRLPSLSGALANAYSQAAHADPPAPIRWMRPLIEMMSADKADPRSPLVGGREEIEGNTSLGLSAVNYSKLDQIRQEKLSVSAAQHIVPPNKSTGEPNEKFADRMVILGKTEVVDTFSVPGPVPPLRGVLIHACAAYTFAQDPLYEFKPNVRLGLDLGLSLLLIGAFAILYVPKEDERHRRRRRAHGYLLLGVLIAAGLLVRWPGILWLDFIVIVFALAIHPLLEHRADAWWEHRREASRDRSRGPEPVPSEAPKTTEPPATEANTKKEET